MKPKLQTIAALLFMAVFMQVNYCYGQHSQPMQMQLYFAAGSSKIDLDYMDNRETLRRIATVFTPGTMPYIASLRIEAYASPEGKMDHNMKLSQRRAEALRRYIIDNYPSVSASLITSVGLGENWAGLRHLVESDYQTPNRSRILYIIDHVPAEINYTTNTSRKKQVMDLGVPTWDYLLKNHFAQLRMGASLAVIVTPKTPKEVIEAIDNTLNGKTDTVYIEKTLFTETIKTVTDTIYIERRVPYVIGRQSEQELMIKTNLLYLATTTPNLAVEFALAPKWTLDISAGLNPWDFGGKRGIRHGLVRPEVRYWLDRRFERHFFGLYGIYGEYQIENIDPKPLLDMAGKRYDGWAMGAGLSYGYQLPTKNRRIKWEFTLSAGYLNLDYKEYTCGTCDTFLRSGRTHYFGPTKAAITLIYIIK